MSKITQPRIKQIRQKNSSGTYPTKGIPLGVDGLLVDMLSSLDLEEELRLGNDHYVEIQDNDDTTVIKEWYFTEKKGNRTIAQMKSTGLITYSTQITITDQTIAMILYEGDISNNKRLHTKNITITENTTLTTIDEGVD